MTTAEVSIILTILVLVNQAWNAWQSRGMKLMIAEMQLNLRSELNGRYVRVASWDDLRGRVQRLEQQHDEAHGG